MSERTYTDEELYGPGLLIGHEGKIAIRLREELATLRANRRCEWTSMYPDEVPAVEAGYVQSGCGHEWMCDEGTDPPGRWMKFCPFCGGAAVFAVLDPLMPGGPIQPIHDIDGNVTGYESNTGGSI